MLCIIFGAPDCPEQLCTEMLFNCPLGEMCCVHESAIDGDDQRWFQPGPAAGKQGALCIPGVELQLLLLRASP